jgi:hypothetical protein
MPSQQQRRAAAKAAAKAKAKPKVFLCMSVIAKKHASIP